MEPGLVRDALTLVLGVLTGMMSAAFGVGGAVISTPGLRLLGASALVAVGTTLPSILPSAATGTARYARARLVDWRVVVATAPAGVVGAVVGALLTQRVPGEGHWLMVATAGILGYTAVRLWREPAGEEGPAGAGARHPSTAALAGLGLTAGGMSGLLGVGGGVVLLPAFLQVLRMPTKEAVATSLACVGILAVPSTISHAALGTIDWRFALLLAAAVVPGARLGSGLAIRTSDRRLRLALATVLGVLAAVYGVSELRSALR
ncbi:MAG TPA: sulfite exporter TauE/SafE family protein [Acidimicrobiales bacterium]|nr:sulfite exporter TauE/SafE family protein [Acidimicrobiales bacterium]